MSDEKDVMVVGVDGSPGSDRALEWALKEARRRHWSVQVVTAFGHGEPEGNLGETAVMRSHREAAERQLTEQLERVAGPYRDEVSLASEVVPGPPVEVLTQASRTAAMLVLGSHGYGRLYEVLVGSVAAGSIRHATCPVVVIPALRPEREKDEVAARPPEYQMGPIY